MPTCGLTLGKYAPLHKGHQFVIETALAEMDHVVVIIYNAPETTRIPLTTRANWLRDLYPTVEIIEAWDGPTEVGDTHEIKRAQEDYILNRLKIKGVTHFYSSEFYGDHMSRALGAVNRLVDPARLRVPITATQIRENPYAYRQFLSPRLYRDLIANIVLLGAPSTGKTTLAERLAQEYGTVWMPEYGREYWEQHRVDRRLSLEQLVEIAEGHLEREEALLAQATRYLFTDTNAITTCLFSLYYHGRAAPRLVQLARQSETRYDLVLLCETDIPYDDTWDRSGEMNRETFQQQIVAGLQNRHIPYIAVRGDLETRVRDVKGTLSEMGLPRI